MLRQATRRRAELIAVTLHEGEQRQRQFIRGGYLGTFAWIADPERAGLFDLELEQPGEWGAPIPPPKAEPGKRGGSRLAVKAALGG